MALKQGNADPPGQPLQLEFQECERDLVQDASTSDSTIRVAVRESFTDRLGRATNHPAVLDMNQSTCTSIDAEKPFYGLSRSAAIPPGNRPASIRFNAQPQASASPHAGRRGAATGCQGTAPPICWKRCRSESVPSRSQCRGSRRPVRGRFRASATLSLRLLIPRSASHPDR